MAANATKDTRKLGAAWRLAVPGKLASAASRSNSERAIPVPLSDARWRADRDNPLRLFAFYMGLVFVFVRISFLHELVAYHFGVRLYLVWLVGTPAIVGALLSGGIRRTFRYSPAYLWAGFALWLLAASPFSFWKGNSIELVLTHIEVNLPMLIVTAGLAVDWRECRRMMFAVALGAIVNLIVWRSFMESGSGRLNLGFGSIGNANDYAAHLLMVLPFLLFVCVTAGPWLVRLSSLLLVIVGLQLIVSTGSRGGLLGLLAGVVFLFLKSSGRARLALVALVPLVTLMIVATVPEYAVDRVATVFTQQDAAKDMSDEAVASRARRIYLLKTSIKYTLQHPLFGVGPGQFINFEGTTLRESGMRGAWQVTHNAYTQVSSEAGVPAFSFFIGAILTTYFLLSKTYRAARSRGHRPIAMAALCVMASLTAFCGAILFLSLAYTYYLLLLSGLAISLTSAAKRELVAEGEVRDNGRISDVQAMHPRRDDRELPAQSEVRFKRPV